MASRRWRDPWDPYFVTIEPRRRDQFVWVAEAICPSCGHVGMWLVLEPYYQVVMAEIRGEERFTFDPQLECERSFPRSNHDRCWSTGWWPEQVAYTDGSVFPAEEVRASA